MLRNSARFRLITMPLCYILEVICRPKASLTTLITLMVMCLTASYAWADLIPPPPQDFTKHYACNKVKRTGLLSKGSIIYVSPLSRKVCARLPEDRDVNVQLTYSCTAPDGLRWVKVSLSRKVSGWCPEDRLLGVIDSPSFIITHHSELHRRKGKFKNYDPETPIIFWTFPRSGEIHAQLEGPPQSGLDYDTIWQDERHKTWIHVPYYRTHKDVWIYADSPHSHEL